MLITASSTCNIINASTSQCIYSYTDYSYYITTLLIFILAVSTIDLLRRLFFKI